VSRLIPSLRTEPLAAWRITRAEFAATALSGQGGLYAEGRWHRAGQPVVYLANAWSLAALEVFIHLGRRDFEIPLIYFGITILPEVSAVILDADALPPDWRSEPPSPDSQAIGSDWLRSNASALLRVQSALSPVESEYNWVVNPVHPDAAMLTVSEPKPFQFDQRMWKAEGRT
jgi:RES domain-containing protein